MKLSLVLLLTLAGTSIIGTIIPQQQDPELYIRQFGRTGFRILDFWGLFDMYHSWWFQLLLLLLVLNLIVCSLERLSGTWKMVFAGAQPFRPERFEGLKNRQEFRDDRSADALRELVVTHLQKMFGKVQVEPRGQSWYLFAEKYRWSRLGVYVVHLSVLLMLIGGLIGSLFGFEGFVTLPEGETISRVRAQNSNEVLELGFEIRCQDFEVSFYDSGQPRSYRSDLLISEQGKPVLEKSIRVNDPLHYQGISVYQSSYGRVPSGQSGSSAPEAVVLNIEQSGKERSHQITTQLDVANELPDGQGTLTLIDYKADFHFKGMRLGPCLLARLVRQEGEPVHLLLPLNFPNFDKMRGGELLISIAETRGWEPSSASEELYYIGLQIKKDPGVWVVYSGFMLMIIGSWIALFCSHQRVCVAITPEQRQQRIVVSGLASKNRAAMDRKVQTLAGRLAEG